MDTLTLSEERFERILQRNLVIPADKVMVDIAKMPDATKVWAAEFCGCEPQTVYDWLKAKKIKKNPSTNRIPFAEVLKMKSLLKPKT